MQKLYVSALVLMGALSATAQNTVNGSQMAPRVEKISILENQTSVAPAKPIFNNATKALGDTILSDDFSDPSNWTISAPNMQGQWEIVTTTPANVTQYLGAMASTTAANGFGMFNAVQYLITGPVNPQQALLTYNGTLDLSAYTDVNIQFQQRYRAFNTDETWVEFSIDNGATWDGIQYNTQYVVNSPSVQNTIETNVSSLIAGESNVMVRFRWTNPSDDDQFGSGYGWMVDDLLIVESPDNEVSVEEVFIGDIVNDFSYSMVPVEQTSPMVIGVSLSNNGSSAFNGNVNVSIKQNGVEVDNFNTAASLPSASVDTLWITSTYTASTVANYTVVASVPADDLSSNNVDSSTIATTQYLWAHDFGGTTARGFNIDDENAIGNLYFPTVNGQLSALNINFATGTTVGQEVEVAVYEVETNIQGTLNFVTETYYTIVAGDISAPFTTIEFGSPVTVEAGKVYLMYAKKSAGTNRMYISGTAGDNDYGTSCFGPFGAGGAVNWYNGYSWAPHVRANFDPSLAIENVSMLDGVSVYPNPSEGIITISNDNGVENTITVYDITGKKVASKVANASTTVDLSAMGTGVYMVEVANENGKKSERVIIK